MRNTTARPILSLSPGSAKALAAPSAERICKPCWSRFKLPRKTADETVIRCPACNANLGKGIGFLQPDLPTAKVRARPAPPAPLDKP